LAPVLRDVFGVGVESGFLAGFFVFETGCGKWIFEIFLDPCYWTLRTLV
jgi:hypothetical protein